MITTTDESWGFFGTLRSNGAADAGAIFDDAARELMARLALAADQARDLLDARIGRHMAGQRRHIQRQLIIGVLVEQSLHHRRIRCARCAILSTPKADQCRRDIAADSSRHSCNQNVHRSLSLF